MPREAVLSERCAMWGIEQNYKIGVMMVEKKINSRILVMVLLTLLLSITLLLFIFYNAGDAQAKTEVDRAATLISKAYEKIESHEELSDYATGNLRITLVTQNGKVLFESDPMGQRETKDMIREELTEALVAGQGEAQRKSETLGYDIYYRAIMQEDGNILRVAMKSSVMNGVYEMVIPYALLIGLGMFGLSVVLSAMFTKSLVRPITQMAKTIDNIEENVPYIELKPFAQAVREYQIERLETEKIREEFTANVSHELKTPLTSISGYAEMIETGMAKQEDVSQFAGKIRFEASRLLNIIGDIIQLGKLDNPGMKKSCTQVDLYAVAAITAEYLSLSGEKAGVTIAVTGESALICGDASMLEELVYNLCDNAIRYNRHGGTVTLKVGKTADGASLISVSDTGIGIAKEHQGRIFERFYRVDKSRSRESGGTGLGLAIVKHVAIQHGASITVKSQPDIGTEITVTFPNEC